MATKKQTAQESAPKAVKAVKTVSIEAAPELKPVAKAKKTVVALLPSEPVVPTAPTKKASKAKHQEADAPSASKQQKITSPALIKPTKEQLAKAVVEQILQPVAVTADDGKWPEIKLILEKLKEDTLREIRKSVKNGTEAVAAIEPGGDIYDQASSERDRELGLLLGDREREKIHSIDEALLRIDEGEYGICEECDEDIPLGRLKAMPFTRHCVKCKSDLEKLQAQTKRVEEERAYREIPLGSEDEEG